MSNNALRHTTKYAPEEALADMEGAMEEAQVVMVEAEGDTVAVDRIMDIEADVAQVDIEKEVVEADRNAVLFQANPVKRSPNNHVIQYLAKCPNKTANKYQDNPANPFLVSNVNLYHDKNADQFHLKNAKAFQLKCAVEVVALVAIEDQVEVADTRAEEDMAIMAKNYSLQHRIAIDKS